MIFLGEIAVAAHVHRVYNKSHFQVTVLDSMGFCVGPAVFDSAHVNVPCRCADAILRQRNVGEGQPFKTGLLQVTRRKS